MNRSGFVLKIACDEVLLTFALLCEAAGQIAQAKTIQQGKISLPLSKAKECQESVTTTRDF